MGRLWSRSTGTPESEQLGDMHSFNEEEPSFLQGPLRPPSYYEATNQSDRVPGIGNVVHHVWSSSQSGVPNTAAITNGAYRTQRSPPPQYSTQPAVFTELPVQAVLPEPEVPSNTGRQPVAQVRPEMNTSHRLDISQEDAQRFENRVRQLQRERALEHRDVTVDGPQANVGDNRRPQQVASLTRRRSNSTESRTSEQSVQSLQDDDEPLDNDPSIELVSCDSDYPFHAQNSPITPIARYQVNSRRESKLYLVLRDFSKTQRYIMVIGLSGVQFGL